MFTYATTYFDSILWQYVIQHRQTDATALNTTIRNVTANTHDLVKSVTAVSQSWNKTQNITIASNGDTLTVNGRYYNQELNRDDDGTVSGGVTIVDDAMVFYGVNGYIDSDSEMSESYSIMWRLSINNFGAWNSYVYDNKTSSSNRNSLLLNTSQDLQFIIHGTTVFRRSTAGLTAWVMFHFCVTTSPWVNKLYINWTQVDSNSITWSFASWKEITFWRRYNNIQFLTGSLESLNKYSRSITSEEVNFIFNWWYVIDWLTLSYTWKNFSGTAWTPTSIHNILPVEGMYDWQVISDFTQDWINYAITGTMPTLEVNNNTVTTTSTQTQTESASHDFDVLVNGKI